MGFGIGFGCYKDIKELKVEKRWRLDKVWNWNQYRNSFCRVGKAKKFLTQKARFNCVLKMYVLKLCVKNKCVKTQIFKEKC